MRCACVVISVVLLAEGGFVINHVCMHCSFLVGASPTKSNVFWVFDFLICSVKGGQNIAPLLPSRYTGEQIHLPLSLFFMKSRGLSIPFETFHPRAPVVRKMKIEQLSWCNMHLGKFLIGNPFHVTLQILSPYSNRIWSRSIVMAQSVENLEHVQHDRQNTK